MTIKDLAEMLSSLGHDIKVRKRSDGGYIISKIDGVSFKGASGNIRARQIGNVTLSQARSYQLARIRPPKKVAPMKRKLTPLPNDIKKELRKVQREWRKTHKDISGTISTRGVRYQLEQYGEEATKAALNKSYRYAQGYAYIENVQWLIERWTSAMEKMDWIDKTWAQEIIRVLQERMLTIKEEWIHSLYYEAYYPAVSQHAISVAEACRITKSIIQA